MKYEKGSFLIVPNKNALKGLKSSCQLVFLWICNYADERGLCFPSRSTLASNCGFDIKTVDRSIKILEEKGFITKGTRKSEDVHLSNIYQINLIEVDDQIDRGSPTVSPRRDKNDTRGRDNSGALTVSSINSIQLTQVKASPFYRSFVENLPKEEVLRLRGKIQCTDGQIAQQKEEYLAWVDEFKVRVKNYQRGFEKRLLTKFGLRKKDHLRVESGDKMVCQ